MAVELKTEGDGGFLLTQEALAAFLRDMTALHTQKTECVLDYHVGAAVLEPTATRKRPRTDRHWKRSQPLRQEIASLKRQLDALHENHDLRESLDRLTNAKRSIDSCKRMRAIREAYKLEQAREQHTRLRRRLAANATLLKRANILVRKLAALTSKSMQAIPSVVDRSHADGALVLRSLRADLDSRCSQLDRIFQQCDENASAALSPNQALWTVTASRCGDLTVSFRESFAMPFTAARVLESMHRFTLLDGREVCAENYVDKVAQTSIPSHLFPYAGARQSERRVILRRITSARGTVLLWEGLSCWHGDDADQLKECEHQAIVRESGWVLIAPVPANNQELSVAHYGGSIRIRAADESRLRTNDALVNRIVRSKQSLHRSRNMVMENVLMDAFLRDKTTGTVQ